jgi:hypothetical protein
MSNCKASNNKKAVSIGLADVEALPNNALMEMYGLPEGLHPPPEGLFDETKIIQAFGLISLLRIMERIL